MIALGWLCLAVSAAAFVLVVVGFAHDTFSR